MITYFYHNNLFLPLFLFGVRLELYGALLAIWGMVAIFKCYPKTLQSFLWRQYLYFRHCRLDIPDMYILLFLCYSQHRHVCKWIRRWLGITLTKAIPYRKWIYFQILVGERKESIFPRQVTKNDPALTFNSISVPHKTCWKRSDLVTFPNPISNGIKQSK